MNFANRQAEKINNANIELHKVKNEKESKEEDVLKAEKQLEQAKGELIKYNEAIESFDKKYFG